MPCSLLSPIPALCQIILAGGDEDTSPADLIEWVQPVLSGIPAGKWLTCEITPADGGTLTTRTRSGMGAPHLALCRSIAPRQAGPACRLLPEPPPVAMILLNDHGAQVMSLLDSVAHWLGMYETHDPRLWPIISLLNMSGRALPAGHETRFGEAR